MIGRFLTESVPACGFSIGFERIIDLVADPAAGAGDAVALVHDKNAEPERLLALKRQLVAQGKRVRLERRTKNLGPLLERLAEAGFDSFAQVGRETNDADELEFKPLGG
jgi:histidyl-tRNA synthetase